MVQPGVDGRKAMESFHNFIFAISSLKVEEEMERRHLQTSFSFPAGKMG